MKLAKARQSTGYSAREFAKAAGLSTRTIWELEQERRLPQPRTVRKFARVLGVAAEEIDEFREASLREASSVAPSEVLAQAQLMEEANEMDLVDASFIRVAAQRSLKEVMAFLVRSGHPEDVDRIYHEVRGQVAGQKED